MSVSYSRVQVPDADRVIVFSNPKAGTGAGRGLVDQLTERLRDCQFVVSQIDDPEQLRDQSSAAFEAGILRTVVAAGGDGTAELVANCTPPGVPVTLLPLGTENLLSKYLKVAPDADQICRSIRAGQAVRLDAGRVGDRLFMLVLSCGFDAEVVRRLHSERSGNIHHLSYAKPIIDSIRSYHYPPLRLYFQPDGAAGGESAESVAEIEAHWAFVFNVPSYAIGLRIVPDAVPTDGLLDVCTLQGGSFWHGLFHLSAIMLGQHRNLDGCQTIRTRRVRIESEGQVPYQLDGEAGGYLPVEVEALPGRLTFVVPESWAEPEES